MLRLRVITALVLAPLVIWGIFDLSETGFVTALLVVMLLASWEWSRLAGLVRPGPRLFFIVGMFMLLSGLGYLLPLDSPVLSGAYLLLALSWLVALLLLLYYRHHPVKPSAFHPLKLLAGAGIICGPFIGLLVLRHHVDLGPQWILYLLLLIWMADTAAFFTGRAFGMHKLLYNVSPGKSWEGVGGGLAGSALLALLGAWWFQLQGWHWPAFVAVSLVVVLVSVAGDLIESLFKRQQNLKDSGRILPGHGGILDRIDSLTAAAPVFVAGLYLMGLLR